MDDIRELVCDKTAKPCTVATAADNKIIDDGRIAICIFLSCDLIQWYVVTVCVKNVLCYFVLCHTILRTFCLALLDLADGSKSYSRPSQPDVVGLFIHLSPPSLPPSYCFASYAAIFNLELWHNHVDL